MIVSFLIEFLLFAAVAQAVNATLTVENVKTWYSGDTTTLRSVAVGDVDGDGQAEIVTGGEYRQGFDIAQLCVWDGATLALENVRTWYWGWTRIREVAIGDVDMDGDVEIVTVGHYNDGTRTVAQLCVWDGATLALENVRTWYWTGDTLISSVTAGDVDMDGDFEIVTGGRYEDSSRRNAQLCVWDGATLALENVKTWYWVDNTYIYSVLVDDVDADGEPEIVTGGDHVDGSRNIAQLCVWDGATLALENVKTWTWSSAWTFIISISGGDVDGDAQSEIVTSGHYRDGTRDIAQLCVWDGATLALEDVKAWYWVGSTILETVAVGDVDADSKMEIVTGAFYNDGTRSVAQLVVWEH